MFVHVVYFWLKHPENDADRQALYAGLQTLKSIDVVASAHIGRPAETRRPVIDHSYDFAWILGFTDKAAHDVYQEHPTHLQFVADCNHLWERVQIYDSIGQ